MLRSSVILANALRAHMAAAGITAQEIASRAGMTAAQLSKYMTGKTVPSLDILDRLAEAIGSTPSAILEDGRKPSVLTRDVEHPIEVCARRWAEETLKSATEPWVESRGARDAFANDSASESDDGAPSKRARTRKTRRE